MPHPLHGRDGNTVGAAYERELRLPYIVAIVLGRLECHLVAVAALTCRGCQPLRLPFESPCAAAGHLDIYLAARCCERQLAQRRRDLLACRRLLHGYRYRRCLGVAQRYLAPAGVAVIGLHRKTYLAVDRAVRSADPCGRRLRFYACALDWVGDRVGDLAGTRFRIDLHFGRCADLRLLDRYFGFVIAARYCRQQQRGKCRR